MFNSQILHKTDFPFYKGSEINTRKTGWWVAPLFLYCNFNYIYIHTHRRIDILSSAGCKRTVRGPGTRWEPSKAWLEGACVNSKLRRNGKQSKGCGHCCRDSWLHCWNEVPPNKRVVNTGWSALKKIHSLPVFLLSLLVSPPFFKCPLR